MITLSENPFFRVAVLPAVVIMYRAGRLPITMDETGFFWPDTGVITAGHGPFSRVAAAPGRGRIT